MLLLVTTINELESISFMTDALDHCHLESPSLRSVLRAKWPGFGSPAGVPLHRSCLQFGHRRVKQVDSGLVPSTALELYRRPAASEEQQSRKVVVRVSA